MHFAVRLRPDDDAGSLKFKWANNEQKVDQKTKMMMTHRWKERTLYTYDYLYLYPKLPCIFSFILGKPILLLLCSTWAYLWRCFFAKEICKKSAFNQPILWFSPSTQTIEKILMFINCSLALMDKYFHHQRKKSS